MKKRHKKTLKGLAALSITQAVRMAALNGRLVGQRETITEMRRDIRDIKDEITWNQAQDREAGDPEKDDGSDLVVSEILIGEITEGIAGIRKLLVEALDPAAGKTLVAFGDASGVWFHLGGMLRPYRITPEDADAIADRFHKAAQDAREAVGAQATSTKEEAGDAG